ncbi:MAG TPA: alpha/beta family hydrolase [Candidatus Bathyarchaeia archaeon]|jgi:predicted alpha/beta-hydrolase family hydrolase|nr:alpha/beta family hydrolase [Candidatus Bathyarchaeia archaeon]
MATGDKPRIAVQSNGEVSALLVRPPTARWLLVLGHGAGAGMTHPFLEKLTAELAVAGVATLRYQFPYMEEGRRVPDSPKLLLATVAAAVRLASESAPGLPLLAGGKSMGGRMTSQAGSENLLGSVKGLVFFGFPLHPPNRPSTKRAEHLAKVGLPMLFLQGTRDTLADLTLLRPICARLGSRATLHIIPEADHSFHVLKKSGKTDAEVMTELAQTTAAWATKLKD